MKSLMPTMNRPIEVDLRMSPIGELLYALAESQIRENVEGFRNGTLRA